jgi:putative tricarboxylic transport membrane protein
MNRESSTRITPALLCLLAALFGLTGASAAVAAEWTPSEKVTMVVHASPGTGIDVFMRGLAEIMTRHKLVARPLVVENVSGGRGERARRHVVTQNAGNPHVLFGFTPSLVNTAILLNSDISVRSYTPIAVMALEPMALFVNAESPYQSVVDLIEAARRKPKGIAQGGGPFGNVPSLTAKMLGDEAKVEFAYVAFKGGGEGVVALLGNHVQFIMEQPSEVAGLVKAGKLRPLAGVQKLEMFPDLPTFASLGYRFKPLAQFRAVVAPPGIPADAVRFYVRVLERARETPEWKQYVQRNELQEIWAIGPEFRAFLEEQEVLYRRLNKEIGLLK